MEKVNKITHNCPDAPLHIYVSHAETEARKAWFEKYKKPVIESFNSSRGIRVRNPFSIDYNNAKELTDKISEMISPKEVEGIRMCFGCDVNSNTGELDIILAPVKKGRNGKLEDIRGAYILASTLRKVDDRVAASMTRFYKNNFAEPLSATLSDEDIENGLSETLNVYFNTYQLESLINETNCQVDHLKLGVHGIRIIFVSYTTTPEVRNTGEKLMRRLTIQFVYTDIQGKEINLEDVDTRYGLPFDGFDTGDPTPPFDNYSDI